MKAKKRQKNPATQVATTDSPSLLVYWLDQFVSLIYRAICNGFFGKVFTSYSKEQESFQDGFLRNHFTKGTKLRLYFRKLREFFSQAFETSFFLNKFQHLSKEFLATPVKTYGNFLFSFGVYTILVYLVRLLVPGLAESSTDVAILGAILCIISIPMLLCRENLATTLGQGVITRILFVDAAGIRDESFDIPTRTSRARSNITILLGMLLGILTLFVHPMFIILAIGLILGMAMILTTPETGVILALFGLPFFSLLQSPAISVGLLVLLTMIGYFIKLIRGKRILKMELLDGAVLLFLLTLFFSGAITLGKQPGYQESLLCCVLIFGYFLVANLMRTERWLKRCLLALVSSATIVACIGILQFVFGIYQTGAWLDTAYFSDISGRVVSLFENPNILGFYLVMILPFAMTLLTRAVERKQRLLCWFSIISMLLCIILTWSRGAWLASIVCILLFLLITSKKTLRWLILACAFIPFLSFFIPQSIVRRFSSIGNIADSSTMYRIYTWKGSFGIVKDTWVGGIGYGPSAFQEVYPQYAYAGIEAATHSHNLFLQILLGAGIGGLLIFLAVLFLSMQMNFEYLKVSKDCNFKMIVTASICSVVAVIIMGLFDFVWYNYRLFFLFWALLAMGCASVRVGTNESRRHQFNKVSEEDVASTDIELA